MCKYLIGKYLVNDVSKYPNDLMVNIWYIS
jgi:hypothetical protein